MAREHETRDWEFSFLGDSVGELNFWNSFSTLSKRGMHDSSFVGP